MRLASLLSVLITILVYLAHGMHYRKFAEKNYDLIKSIFPSFMIFPKKRTHYVWCYKFIVSVMLGFFIGIFVLALMGKIPDLQYETQFASRRRALEVPAKKVISDQKVEHSIRDFIQ